MRRFDYKCPTCAKVEEHLITRADGLETYHFCSGSITQPHPRVLMERLPAAPAFTIKGFSAKNGYSG